MKIANIKRSTYYYHKKNRKNPDKYAAHKNAILKIFNANKSRYGYRRICLVLRNNSLILNHKTVLKLMKDLNLSGKSRKTQYKSYKGKVGKIARNILNRQFKANAPFEKLVTDVTQFSVCNEKLFLSPVLDLFNSEIVSYSISKSPNFAQTTEMLEGLFAKLPKGSNPLLHSDQGWQYQMKEYQSVLKGKNIIQSMSRKGNCLDNSVMENFFGRLKVEMFYGETFQTIKEFEIKLKEYINYFNNDRISLKFGGLSPVQYRTKLYQ